MMMVAMMAMKRYNKTLTIAICLMACIQLALSASPKDFDCNHRKAAAGDPKFPGIKGSFTTEISGKDLIARRSFVYHEFYDDSAKLWSYYTSWLSPAKGEGSIVHLSSDKTKQYVKGWVANQCKNITSDEVESKMANLKGQGLRLLEDLWGVKFDWIYAQKTQIRGFNTQYWTSCLKDGPYGRSGMFTYYFTLDKIPKPIRMVFKGTNNKGKDFHYVYDYFMFFRKTPNPSVFTLPGGVECPDEADKVKTPLPKAASYKLRAIDAVAQSVTDSTVYYDYFKGIYSYQTDQKKTVVRDFKRGIEFEIDQTNLYEPCTRTIIGNVARPDTEIDKNGRVHMADLEHFFHDTGKFVDNGIRTVRGIRCRLYSRTAQSDFDHSTTVLEMYIADNGVQFVGNLGRYNPINPIVRVRYLKDGDIVTKEFDIYDFDPEPLPLYDPFDLSACYDEDKTLRLQMVLSGSTDVKHQLRHGEDQLMQSALNAIASALKLTYTSVAVENVITDKDKNYILNFKIFDKEPSSSQFAVEENKRAVFKDPNVKKTAYKDSTNTPDLCMGYCLNTDKKPISDKTKTCTGFQLDRASKTCTFYLGYVYPKSFTIDRSADYYKNTYRSGTYPDYHTLEQKFDTLEALVLEGKLPITYTDKTQTPHQSLNWTPKSLTKIENAKNTDPNLWIESTENRYFIKRRDKWPTYKEVETVPNAVKSFCLERCFKTKKYTCQAVLFDNVDKFGLGVCKMYDKVQNLMNRGKNEGKLSMFWIRNYLSNFFKVVGKKALPNKSEYVYNGIGTQDCAELCVRSKDIYCQSFEVCGDVCILGTSHFYDVAADAKTMKRCTHYSRNYVQDYSKHEHTHVKASTSSVVEIKSAGVKECAMLCSTSDDFDCNVFTFCGVSSRCLLNTKAVTKSDGVYYETKDGCDMYSRKPSARRFIRATGEKLKLTAMTKGSHSSGSMAGIGFGMLIGGFVLIVIVAVVVLKLKGSGKLGGGIPNVNYNKERLDADFQ